MYTDWRTETCTWASGQHHAKICEALESVERGEVRRLMIETPPRHSKSELASKLFPAWYLGRHPSRQVIATSYSGELAIDFGQAVRDHVREPQYQRLFPGVELDPDSKAKSRWHTNSGGIFTAAGVGGSITGKGGHLCVVDDPLKNRDEADSERIRESIWKWYTSTLLTRLMPGGAIVLIMTRWHEDDLAGRAMQTENWTRITMPAIANEGTDNERALWPEWYPLEELRKTREIMSKGGRSRDWEALYQQRPTPESGTYMQAEWFRVRYLRPPENMSVYICSDFAVTDAKANQNADYTEHGVFGVGEDGRIFVLDWWAGQTTGDVWIEALLDLAEKWSPTCWFGEAGVIRRAIEPYLIKRGREREVYFRKEWITSTRDKSARGRAFQARAASDMIRFPAKPWADRVVAQCVSFGGGASVHDDAFDVMSLMCSAMTRGATTSSTNHTHRGRRDRYGSAAPAGDWKTA